jgi:hypothetical protein
MCVLKQHFIDVVDLVVRNAGEGVGEPSLWIDAIQFGGFDQVVGDASGFASGLRSDEQVVFAAQSDRSHGTFGGIIVDLQDAMIEVGAHPCHSSQGIADRCGQRAFTGYKQRRFCGQMPDANLLK